MKKLIFILCTSLLSLNTQAQDWQVMGKFDGYIELYADTVEKTLYVFGDFTKIDTTKHRKIAAWKNSQWQHLGYGIDYDSTSGQSHGGSVGGILREGDKLLITGGFKHVDNYQKSKNMAYWLPDSNKWETVHHNPSAYVYQALHASDGKFYLCGSIDTIGQGVLSPYATYYENGQWQPMGYTVKGATSSFYTVIEFKKNIYFGGSTSTYNGNPEDLAKWNGSTFESVGIGIRGGIAWVNDFAVYNDELYIGGAFYKANGNTANHIMKYDGNQLIDISSDKSIGDLTVYKGILYACGDFTEIGGVKANRIAWFDGRNWNPLCDSDLGSIHNMAFLNDTLYVARNRVPTQVYRYTNPLPTSVIEIKEKQSAYTLFPNPSSNEFTINAISSEEIEIVNGLGEMVLIGKAKNTIDCRSWQSGIYYVKIKNKEKIEVLKFIKD